MVKLVAALLCMVLCVSGASAQLSTGGGISGQAPGVPPDIDTSNSGGGGTPANTSVTAYGAKCDGVTDDTSAFNLAFITNTMVSVPSAICFSATGVTIPSNHTLQGTSFSSSNPPNSNGYLTSTIVCPNTVPVCVTMGTTNPVNGATSVLRSITVQGVAGTPSGGSTGVWINGGYNIILEDVFVQNFDYGYHFQSQQTCVTGLGATGNNLYSGAIRVAHLWFDSWTEAKIINSTFGENGVGDFANSDYVRISGGCQFTSGGPNTLMFTNDQFNQGTGTANAWLNFLNLGTGGTGPIGTGEFFFTDCYVEGAAFGIITDATWNILRRIRIANGELNIQGPMFAINAATALSEIAFVNEGIYSTTFNLTSGVGAVAVSNSYLTGTVNIASSYTSGNGIVNSAVFTGNTFAGSTITFSGQYAGAGGVLYLANNAYNGLVTNVTISATGNVQVLDVQPGRNGTGLPGNTWSTGLGYNSLANITSAAQFDVAYGAKTLESLTSGSGNTAVGVFGLQSLTTSSSNSAFGFASGQGVTTGTGNSLFGYHAGSSITTGGNNTILGTNVGSTTLTTGNSNILIGTQSNCDTTTAGAVNTFMICGTTGSTPLLLGNLASGAMSLQVNGSGAGDGLFTINNAVTAHQAILQLSDAGVAKWIIEKPTDNSFGMYNSASGKFFLLDTVAGAITLGESAQLILNAAVQVNAPTAADMLFTLNGTTAGQQSILQFSDAGTVKWIIEKTASNGFGMYDSATAHFFLQVSPTGVLTLGEPAAWTANGTVATSVTSLGPAGSHTTIQTWFTVTDSTGTVRYIPAY